MGVASLFVLSLKSLVVSRGLIVLDVASLKLERLCGDLYGLQYFAYLNLNLGVAIAVV